MGVAGHQGGDVLAGEPQQGAADCVEAPNQLEDLPPQAHPVLCDAYIVAAASCMNAARVVCAAEAFQFLFDVKEQVFTAPVITSGGYRCAVELVEAVQTASRNVLWDDALLRQH